MTVYKWESWDTGVLSNLPSCMLNKLKNWDWSTNLFQNPCSLLPHHSTWNTEKRVRSWHTGLLTRKDMKYVGLGINSVFLRRQQVRQCSLKRPGFQLRQGICNKEGWCPTHIYLILTIYLYTNRFLLQASITLCLNIFWRFNDPETNLLVGRCRSITCTLGSYSLSGWKSRETTRHQSR